MLITNVTDVSSGYWTRYGIDIYRDNYIVSNERRNKPMIVIKTMSEENTREEVKENMLNRIKMVYEEVQHIAAESSLRLAPQIRLIEVNLDELKNEISLL